MILTNRLMMGEMSSVEVVREFCRSLPHATEHIQWADDLVFKIGGKMFAVAALEPSPVWLSFKCGPDDFAELIERPGVVPAPYLARAHWVGLQSPGALPRAELLRRLRSAYDLVAANLPRKIRAELSL